MKIFKIIVLMMGLIVFGMNPASATDNTTSLPVIIYNSYITGNITSSSGSSAYVQISTAGFSSVQFSITPGTSYVATLVPQVSVDGTNYYPVYVTPTTGGTAVNSISTGTGSWTAGVAGMAYFRVIATSYTSGTIPLTLNAASGTSVINCVNCNL